MTSSALIFLSFFTLSTLLLLSFPIGHGEEIRCERWQGKWWQKFNAVRCIKSDGAGSNNIVVSHKIPCGTTSTRDLTGNVAPCLLKYTVGMWTGICGENDGQNNLYPNQYLRRRATQTYFFDAAGPGICKEFYVFECTKDGRPYDCYYAVRLTPAPAAPLV
ncbi:unnamed protein product [Allacma fusca]|uniref:Secreted protein n=1 Tax=Allacma fusca TaxID=39272 RepID=A0A8J2JBI0_9HEXA|nr:unnamed protein product [Allacma fusca]